MLKIRTMSYVDAPGFRHRLAAVLARAAAGLVGSPFVTRHFTMTVNPTRPSGHARYLGLVDDLKTRQSARCLERVNGSIPLPAPRTMLALEAPVPAPVPAGYVDVGGVRLPVLSWSADTDAGPPRRPPAPPVLAIGTRRDKSTGEVIIGEITLPLHSAWIRPAPPAPRPTCPGPEVYRFPPELPTAAAMLATRATRCPCTLPPRD